VDLVEVDVVRAESREGGVDLLHDGLAGQTGAAETVVHLEEHLRGQDDVLTAGVAVDGTPDDLFGGAVSVDVGRVPQRDPGLDCLPEDGRGAVVVERPAAEAP